MPVKPKVGVRKAYGKPWSKAIGEVGTNKEFLKEVGKILVKQIIKEGKADLGRQGNGPTPRGEPEGLPNTEEFWKSFGFRITGRSEIEITSTWAGWTKYLGPNWRYTGREHMLIDAIREGRRERAMKWLTREKGVGIVPLKGENGEVVFRWAPNQSNPWVHPGFAKHNFIDRAFKKAKREIKPAAVKALKKALAGNGNLT